MYTGIRADRAASRKPSGRRYSKAMGVTVKRLEGDGDVAVTFFFFFLSLSLLISASRERGWSGRVGVWAEGQRGRDEGEGWGRSAGGLGGWVRERGGGGESGRRWW